MKNMAIKENHLYQKAYQSGKRFAGKYVAVYVLRDRKAKRIKEANPQKKFVNRLGLSVSKKIGGAVVRNRTKRILRAAYDEFRDQLKCGNLIVICARGAIVGKKSTDVAAELRQAFSRLEMFEKQP